MADSNLSSSDLTAPTAATAAQDDRLDTPLAALRTPRAVEDVLAHTEVDPLDAPIVELRTPVQQEERLVFTSRSSSPAATERVNDSQEELEYIDGSEKGQSRTALRPLARAYALTLAVPQSNMATEGMVSDEIEYPCASYLFKSRSGQNLTCYCVL